MSSTPADGDAGAPIAADRSEPATPTKTTAGGESIVDERSPRRRAAFDDRSGVRRGWTTRERAAF